MICIYAVGRERCAICAQWQIETLNDLFTALFKPGEEEGPVIRQPQRPLREALFALFFPDALVKQFEDKSKSNLTWFFNSDPRNKSVRRSLVALLREDTRTVVDETHRKCHDALWPRAGHAVFDARALRQVLAGARVNSALNVRWHITQPANDGHPSRLDVFFEVDEAAALARMLLTLAVGGDVPSDTMGEIWRDSAGGSFDFLRGDETVAGRIRYCRMLDLQGRHERAFEGFEALAKQLGRPAQTLDESTMYCRMGEMLFTGEGCLRDEKAALASDRLGCLDENPKSWYQLAKHASGSPAREAMERAVELGYPPAIRELGMAWYNGSARLACVRSVEFARRCFQKGLTIPGPDGAYCAYMLGQIYEAQNARSAAINAYRVAQEGGSAEAAERLSRLDWMLTPEKSDAAQAGVSTALKYCLTNEPTGVNRLFLEELQGRWDITVCGARRAEAPVANAHLRDIAPQRALRELTQGVYWGGAPQFPELVIALMSQDWQDNLCQAVALLGELQRLAEALGDRAWDLVDQVSMYVMAEHDYASLLLDAAFAGMGQLYFRVRICDPALDAADQLFAAAPLFLPRLRAPEGAKVALKLIGCGDTAMAVLRRAVALPMPDEALSVDVYGQDAETMDRRFRQLCPGMVAAQALCDVSPRFHHCALESELVALLDDAGEDGLAAGNYFVVATEDDALNLRLAVLLRGELMKRNLEADGEPFIAVSARHPTAGWLTGSLPSGLEAAQGTSARCYSQYDLFAFGAYSMYAPSRLAQDVLERRARQAHMLFIGLPNTRDARHAAMGSYYKRQYNRDTARATAQSLIYRMHLAGVSLPGWRLYGVPDEEALLGPAYTRWLKDAEHLQQAVRDEHARRNRMQLALGWAPATAEQVTAYVRRGNPSHLLYTARMNPFICPWEQLESGELLRAVRGAVRSRYPEKSVPDPRRDEEESVRDTERLLTE